MEYKMILTIKPRVLFDINDKKHMDAVAKFLKHNAWGKTGCPFVLEEPWLSIPDMIKDRIVRKHLGIK